MVDALLAESDPKLAGELLRQHGPITAEEVPYLAQKAETGRAVVRANAARYLGLAPAPEAVVALRGLLGKTDDLAVYAFALGALLDEPDARALAGARPQLVLKALHHTDPEIAAIGIRAAWLAGLPDVADELAAKLQSRKDKERTGKRNTDFNLDACDRYLGTLAGRQFLLDDRYDAMEFARSWLAAHPG